MVIRITSVSQNKFHAYKNKSKHQYELKVPFEALVLLWIKTFHYNFIDQLLISHYPFTTNGVHYFSVASKIRLLSYR